MKTRSVQEPDRANEQAHPSGTWKDVNLNPVSSFFAPEIPRGILPVLDFDFEVANPEYLFDPFSTNRFHGLGPFAFTVAQRESVREYNRSHAKSLKEVERGVFRREIGCA